MMRRCALAFFFFFPFIWFVIVNVLLVFVAILLINKNKCVYRLCQKIKLSSIIRDQDICDHSIDN